MFLSPEQTIILGHWMESPNQATSTLSWLSMPAPHPLGFPEVDASRLFDSMDATMAGWSVPAGSGPPAAAGGAAAALAARGPESSSGVSAQPSGVSAPLSFKRSNGAHLTF